MHIVNNTIFNIGRPSSRNCLLHYWWKLMKYAIFAFTDAMALKHRNRVTYINITKIGDLRFRADDKPFLLVMYLHGIVGFWLGMHKLNGYLFLVVVLWPIPNNDQESCNICHTKNITKHCKFVLFFIIFKNSPYTFSVPIVRYIFQGKIAETCYLSF